MRGGGPLGGVLDGVRILGPVVDISGLDGTTKVADLNSVLGVAGKLDGVTQATGGLDHVTDVANVGNVGKVGDAATLKSSSDAL